MKNVNSLQVKRSDHSSVSLSCTAFAGHRRIASGALAKVTQKLKALAVRTEREPILVFDDSTGKVMEINLDQAADDKVVRRSARTERTCHTVTEDALKRGPGRPKLGVIPREVTLLPDQWDWLDQQPSGASSALRQLVYEAKRSRQGLDRTRQSQEAAYRFMTTMAGNFPGFEEALRAFYRRDNARFDELVEAWPKDIRSHVKKMVAKARQDETR